MSVNIRLLKLGTWMVGNRYVTSSGYAQPKKRVINVGEGEQLALLKGCRASN